MCPTLMACAAQLASIPGGYRPRDPTRTALYSLVAEQRATFAQVADAEGGVPSFVSDSFDRFLRCGVLAHGFARFECDDCGYDHLVALSCKARGLCPSCGGRRMMTLARHVMDAELPHVPVRQWVLTSPLAKRDPPLLLRSDPPRDRIFATFGG